MYKYPSSVYSSVYKITEIIIILIIITIISVSCNNINKMQFL